LWVYLSLFLFNTGTTWWVWNASAGGAIAMLICNSLIMSLPFVFYSHLKKTLPQWSYAGFVFAYLAFEYWHFNWGAAWPWLTLGKG
ncbi:MAG: apolipoprotein N-acyltransferase, partial [Bacteroidia bacterium]|nr:apolipoprotein N-acyltransferase [Bacteroidia bacterium]